MYIYICVLYKLCASEMFLAIAFFWYKPTSCACFVGAVCTWESEGLMQRCSPEKSCLGDCASVSLSALACHDFSHPLAKASDHLCQEWAKVHVPCYCGCHNFVLLLNAYVLSKPSGWQYFREEKKKDILYSTACGTQRVWQLASEVLKYLPLSSLESVGREIVGMQFCWILL